MAVHTPARFGLVPPHPADDGSRDHPLLLHLAELLGALGVVVDRYDRRAASQGRDLPLADQAADARAVMARLRDGSHARVGLWASARARGLRRWRHPRIRRRPF
jgi:alpha/beta superfamily hydrolase